MTILFVDDDPNIRAMWKDQAQEAGFDTLFADCTDGAFAILNAPLKPDAVVADDEFPVAKGMPPRRGEGSSVLAYARYRKIPIRIAASGDEETRKKMVAIGHATLACPKQFAVDMLAHWESKKQNSVTERSGHDTPQSPN